MILGSTVTVAGGIFPAQLVERIAAGDPALKGTAPADYHLDSANELNQAINRAWTALTGRYVSFRAQLGKLPESDRGTTLTREKWLLPLFQELGYGRLSPARAIESDGRSFAISHGWQEALPVHLVGWRIDIDKRIAGERGAAASPPHGLVQDCLNNDDGRLWAFLSNGRELRVLRDHRSLTRQAYVSFDLEGIFDAEQFSAFRLLWLMCHQSRVEAAKPSECWLERWVNHAQQEGVRALDRLREGVESALSALGRGFVRHRANEALKARLVSGELSPQEYYRQLLKLVYRLIFLFVAEDRDLLLVPDAPEAAKNRFRRLYATRRLRSLAMARRGGPHEDGWHALRLLMRQLDRGNPDLALPGLGSFLWSTDGRGGTRVSRAIPDLDGSTLANEDLFAALQALCVVQDGPVRRPVDWSGVQSEELGSVYEALMEKVPRMNVAAGAFDLADAAGNERKTTGSYYTPTSLVDCLLDTALDPVLDEAERQPDPARAILDLSVVDPACGSGHFLVAAARRMAHRLARVRAGGIEPSPPEVQHALRDVVGRCIYGVDLNPMAVELCKVSLWMEAIEPGRPLSFLDGHIRHGNALIGTTPELMDKGVPDEAWDPIEGDDKEVAKRLKKDNKNWKQTVLFAPRGQVGGDALTTLAVKVEEADDATRDAVEAKEAAWRSLDAATEGAWSLADLWCAAFVWPKHAGEAEQAAPVRRLWEAVKADAAKVPAATRKISRELAEQYDFFHWHLAFPKVFGRGGFDVVLGNPPWDQIQLDAREWFATSAPDIANAVNLSDRMSILRGLSADRPELHTAFREAQRVSDDTKRFVHASGRYKYSAFGRLNSAPLFFDHAVATTRSAGRVGVIVPSGIATDSFTQHLFHDLMIRGQLISMWEFENEGFFSAGKGHMLRFAVIVAKPGGGVASTDFAFQCKSISELATPDRHFQLSAADIGRINPNTGTCPIFFSRRDATISAAIHSRFPVLHDEKSDLSPWGFYGLLMFMMSSDSNRFRREPGELAQPCRLFEAKMIYTFNHRHGDFANAEERDPHRLPEVSETDLQDPEFQNTPRYWMGTTEVDKRLSEHWQHGWVICWRDVTDARASIRSVVATVVPRTAVGNTLALFLFDENLIELAPAVVAALSSFAFDYVARQKIGGLHLTFHIMKQLPLPTPSAFTSGAEWCPPSTRIVDWLLPRVLELTYTAWDLEAFAKDVGYDGPPFRWNAARRFLLRAEVDAAFFHLYRLAHDDTDYILGTFDVLERSDVRKHGEYRTKRVVLEIYDAMAEAARTGVPYVTRLDPPPADPRVAHPRREAT